MGNINPLNKEGGSSPHAGLVAPLGFLATSGWPTPWNPPRTGAGPDRLQPGEDAAWCLARLHPSRTPSRTSMARARAWDLQSRKR